MKNNDVALIQRVLEGDDTAFSALVEKYQRSVHALAWRKIGDFHIAEDITQDTFLKAYQRLSTLKKPQRFASWLYVIAANHCSTWLRKKRLWTESLENTSSGQVEKATYSGHVIAENEQVAMETQREVVKNLLAKLQESERTVMVLYYLGEMSYEEISEFLGVSVAAIKNRLYRARNRLKKEEPMIREALGNFQITPNLTENIMREISRLKTTAPSGGKPFVPWAIGVSALAVAFLILGIANHQSLSRFQKPYSFNAASEMKVELIDAPIVLNLDSEPDNRTQLGNANVQGKSNGDDQQANNATSLDLETIITKMKHYDNAVTSVTGDFVIERGTEINEYTLAFEGEKVWVQPKERRYSNVPDIHFWNGERLWEIHRPDNLLFTVEIKPNKESTVLEKVQQAFKQVGIELADDVRIVPAKLKNSFRIMGKEKTYFILFVGETMLEVYDDTLEYAVRPDFGFIDADQDPRFWLTFPNNASTDAYLSQPLWQLLEKHESELIETEILNGEKTSVIRLNRPRTVKLWISHDKGFRLVKSENTFTIPPEENRPEGSPFKAGVTYVSTRIIEYQEYLPDVWFPKVMVKYMAPKTSSEPKEEDFISKTVFRTRQCRLNADVSELFRLDLSPDTLVRDYAAKGVRPVRHVLDFGSKSDIQQQPGSAATSSSIDDSDQHTDDPAGRDLQQPHLPEGAKSRLGKGRINAITYSADGTRLAVASSIGIWLYDTHNGQALDLLTTHTDYVNSVGFSPDGRTLVSGSKDGIIRLWDTQTGILRRSLIGHTGSVSSVVFSADGTSLASRNKDNTIRLWNAQTGELQNTLKGHTNAVLSVAFGPNGKTLASGSKDNTIRLWNAQTGELQNTLTLIGHKGEIAEMAFSPDGKTLAAWTWEWESPIHLWDVETGELLNNLVVETNDNVNNMAFSPDGKTLASPLNNGTIRLWNTQTGKLSRILIGHTSRVFCVAFSPDGKMLASGSYDGTLRLWDAETGELRNTRTGYTSAVVNVAFSPDENIIASAMNDDTVGLWNAQTGVRHHTLKVARTHSIESLSFSPDGKTLVGAGYGRIIHLWDAETGELRDTLGGHTDVVAGVAFNLDGKTLASGGWDKTVRLWDAQTGTLHGILEGHTDWVNSVAFSSDGKTLASGSKDKTIHLWDVETGALQNTLKGHTAEIGSVAFSPDGKTLASGSNDGIIHLWDVETGTIRQTTGHLKDVESVAFSPDGRTLVSGSWDKTIHLYDVQTDTTVRILEGHTDWVRSVAFSPDGRTLMSGSQDGTLLLWEITPDATD
ncbi:sigma-70 family RNA polymerase sigma factor [Candidatus Poribacteria bacterium]|nr:sigma-70 family RNA polymerase sigma factor [Candidatus Poribacteria bacterium]